MQKIRAISVVVVALVSIASAQFSGLDTGVHDHQTYVGDHEVINPMTGNLHIEIPLLSFHGRGGKDFPLTMSYNSSMWFLSSFTDPVGHTTYSYNIEHLYFHADQPGWHLGLAALQYLANVQMGTNGPWCDTNYVLVLPDGGKHSVNGVKTNCYQKTQSGLTYPVAGKPLGETNDFIAFDADHKVATLRDGTRITFPSDNPTGGQVTQMATEMKDRNGNKVTFNPTSITDSVGRQITLGNSITYTDDNGQPATITTSSVSVNISPSFPTNTTNPPTAINDTGPTNMLGSITLPNQTSYTFEYNNYGELTKITYPTGGYTRYEYGAGGDTQNQYGSGCCFLTAKHVCRDSRGNCTVDTEDTTNFVPQWATTQPSVLVSNTITYPASTGAQMVISEDTSAYPTHEYTKIYDHGSLIRTIDRAKNGSSWPVSETVTLDDGKQSRTDWSYDDTYPSWDSGCVGDCTVRLDHPTEIKQTGYDGLVISDTKYTYSRAYWNASTHIYDLPQSIQTFDGSGTLVSQTTNSIDDYSTFALDGSHNGATSHDPAYDATYGTRGNITAVTRLAKVGGASVTEYYQFDTLGNKVKSRDPGGHDTTYDFSDRFGTKTQCLPADGKPTYGYQTQVINALGHKTQQTFYSCSGLVWKLQDPNDLAAGRDGTVFVYDNLQRLRSKTAADGGNTTIDYNLDALPLVVATTTTATPNPSIVSKAQHDGLGRVVKSQLTSDPEGVVITDTVYDAIGRVSSVSNPYRSTSDATYGLTTTSYDVLDRVRSVTHPDGNLENTDFVGNVMTAKDASQRWRQSVTDARGRVVEVHEPSGDGATSATSSVGRISVSGTLKYQQVQTQWAAAGHATLTVTTYYHYIDQQCNPYMCYPAYNSGCASVTIGNLGGVSACYTADINDLINGLVSGINSNPGISPYVSATIAGGVINLDAKTLGYATNYSLQVSQTWDTQHFGGPPYLVTPSGPQFTGGQDDLFQNNPDSGTTSISANSHTTQYTWSGSNTTPASITAGVCGQINTDLAASVAASTISADSATNSTIDRCPNNGSTVVYVASLTPGTAGNSYSYSSGTTSQLGSFQSAALDGCSPQSVCNLAGGINGPYITRYFYDALDNLLCAEQHGNVSGTGCNSPSSSDATSAWRVRRFTYDALSRLLTATNRESGTICNGTWSSGNCVNGYDADSNLLAKTDARGLTVNYGYDAIHRLKIKTYSDGSASREYFYDVTPPFQYNAPDHGSSIGRLTHASNDVNAAYDPSYDAVGRVTAEAYCLPSDCSYTSKVTASYDLAGHMTSLIYPSGRKINNSYNGAGRLTGVTFDTFNATPVNYPYLDVPQNTSASSWGYWPTGALRSDNFGNGVQEIFGYNSRLQITAITAANSSTLLNKTYNYADPNYGNANNGNVININDGISSNRNQSFNYDQLNRLVSGVQADGAFSETFSVDPWGNLKQSGSWSFQQAFDQNNRIAGWSYDAAGNLLNDGNHNFAYDAEARIKSVDATGATYTYDADGERVRKDAGSSGMEYLYFAGQVIAEKNPATGDWTDYIFAGERRIAKSENYDLDLHIKGTNNAASQYSIFYVSNAAGLGGYVIKTGDKLYIAQYQPSGSHGGMILAFTGGTNSNWSVKDQDGYYLNDDGMQNSTHMRKIDLSSLANKTISDVAFVSEADTQTGTWGLDFQEVVLVGADGVVHPIYTNENSISFRSITGSGSVTGRTYTIDRNTDHGPYPNITTHYFHADHLGTARAISTGGGWPVWQGTFAPFGQEVSPQITTDHFRFTGKERDSESGLDYFAARYYGGNMGRMLTPDPSGLLSVDLSNPQSWNLFSYSLNNPLRLVDPTGLDPCDTEPVAASDVSGKLGDETPCPSPLTPPPSVPEVDPCQGKGDNCYKQEEADSVAGGLAIQNPPCLQSALRDVIAAGEVPGEPNDGYGTVVHGTVVAAPPPFSNLIGTTNAHIANPGALTGHPHILVRFANGPCPDNCSTAFGRYQILARYAGSMSMSPASQDAYANREMRSIGALRDAASDDFQAAVADLGKRWQSMPGTTLGGHQISLQRAVNVFLQSASGCR
jgi:RHS repeat-associated protein